MATHTQAHRSAATNRGQVRRRTRSGRARQAAGRPGSPRSGGHVISALPARANAAQPDDPIVARPYALC